MHKELWEKARAAFPNAPDHKILEGYKKVKEVTSLSDEELLGLEVQIKAILQTSFLARATALAKRKLKGKK